MTGKNRGLFEAFKGQGDGVDSKVRVSHVDGDLEIDESLNPIDKEALSELMRQDNKAMAKVMDETMETRADHSALDL